MDKKIDKKIFDDYLSVDCNDCERWWLNQCDGVKTLSEGQKVPCKTFLATRNVIIPQQIKMLQKRVLWLELCVGVLLVVAGVLFIVNYY